MTKADNFKQLKADALRNYADYMDMITKFSCEDLKDLKNRLLLLDAYNKSVLSNAAYRNFINEKYSQHFGVIIKSILLQYQ